MDEFKQAWSEVLASVMENMDPIVLKMAISIIITMALITGFIYAVRFFIYGSKFFISLFNKQSGNQEKPDDA